MMTRRVFLSALAAGPRKPNFVILLADDMGYGDIGCYGSADVPTPHIDALARGGTRFTDGYVSCAVCSPSRAALLTGRYQHRFGHEFNSGSVEREAEIGFGLPKGEKIAPEYLKAAGYRSMAVGKWHLGVRAGFHPMERGFDEFFGFLTGGNDFLTARTPGATAKVGERDAPIWRGRKEVVEDRYLTDAFADEAVEFIDRNRSHPFLLYFAPNAIHTPLQALERYVDRVAGIKERKHRLLAAMTVALDDAVGRIVSKLKELGLERDTMIVFLSDNGCPEETGAGTNGPLNGEKTTYYEGGIRVPFIMRWPGKVPAGKTYREMVVSRDLLPTMLAAAGVKGPAMDGVDLLPYLNKGGRAHEVLFWRAGKARAVRQGKWKLLEFGDELLGLYDLAADMGETRDLSGANPAVVKELREAWAGWSGEMKPAAWPPRYREVTVNGKRLNWEL